MGTVFGKPKKKSRVTEQDRAVLQLKQQRDKMKQYQKKIVTTLEKERELAKTLLQQGKKDRAKLLLRKKKRQEQILAQTDAQLEKMEEMVHSIEYATIEVQVIEGLKRGNAALKQVHDLLSVEDIERILDETHESVEKQRELDSLLSGALSNEDEDDVLKELDELVASELPPTEEAKLTPQKTPEVPMDEEEVNLPDVPSERPGIEEKNKPERRKERVLVAAS